MTRITLPAHVDLAVAAMVADQILTAPSSAIIDASAVQRIGLPGLQMLLSAQIGAKAAGSAIVIERPTAMLIDAARLAGADRLFPSSSDR